MLSREKLIEKAFGVPYEKIKDLYNSDYYVFTSVMKRHFPDYEIKKETNHFIDGGARFRPVMLHGISDNNKWRSSLYHQQKKPQKCPFEEGSYYHIGFMGHDGSFSYQGVRQFNEGFKDDEGYWLRPFPTHYIKVEKPGDALYHQY